MLGDGLKLFNNKKSNTTIGAESFYNNIDPNENIGMLFKSSIGDMYKLDNHLYSTALAVEIPFINDIKLSKVYFEIDKGKLTNAQKYAYKKITDNNGITNNVDISNYKNIINNAINTEYSISALKKLLSLESVFIDSLGKVYYQASINSPRSDFKNINLEFATDKNVTRINDIKQLESNTKLEHDIFNVYDIELHDVIAKECIAMNKDMFTNIIVAQEGFVDSIKNIWNKFVAFLKKICENIKKFIMYIVNWFRGVFSKKYERVDDAEKIYKSMSKEQKAEWNRKVAEDMKLYLNEEEIVSLTPTELNEVFEFGKQFCPAAEKIFKQIVDEISASEKGTSELGEDLYSSSKNYIFGDNLYETYKKNGLNFNYTGDNPQLKRIFSMESHELKLDKRKLVEILKEFGLEKQIEGSDILDLYNKTFDYFKNNITSISKQTETLLSELNTLARDVDKSMNKIQNAVIDKHGFGGARKEMGKYELIITGTMAHVGLIQSLIITTTQNHAILYNKILAKFRKQFSELNNVSNTHVNIADSTEIMKFLSTKTPVTRIEGINAYTTSDICYAIRKTMSDNNLANQTEAEVSMIEIMMPNAFATMLPPVQTPIIAITQSMLDNLPKDSVDPVLYHEYGHIKNNDMITSFYKLVNYCNKNKVNGLKYIFGGFRTFAQESAADMVAVEFCGADNAIKMLQDLLDAIGNYYAKKLGAWIKPVLKTCSHEVYARIGRIKGDRDD